jgi:4-oxalocrotonate tautomerase
MAARGGALTGCQCLASHLLAHDDPAIAEHWTGEAAMPEVYIHAVKGRTLEQKRGLIKDVTDAVVKNFSVPIDAVMVEIVESEPTAKAKGGVLFSERR